MSATWLSERTITDAEAVAQERLARYQTEREERMAAYRRTWELRWAKQRATAARPGAAALWRVK